MLKKIRNLRNKVTRAYRRHGLWKMPQVALRRLRHFQTYQSWVVKCDKKTDLAMQQLTDEMNSWPSKPLISVLMPTWNTDPRWLSKAVESVFAQVYQNWELCIADDASFSDATLSALNSLSISDPRVKVVFRSVNGHISEASNTALEMVRGDYVVLLDHDDELHRLALYYLVKEVNSCPDAVVIYSDEDKIDTSGRRFDPYFKPDWNADLFLSQNMISHLGAYRTDSVRAVGGFRKGYEGSQDYDLALRVTSRASNGQIRHIPEVLYHWRAIPGSTAVSPGEKDYASIAAHRALVDVLSERKIGASVLPGWGSFKRIKYSFDKTLLQVHLVVWSTQNGDDLAYWESFYRAYASERAYSVQVSSIMIGSQRDQELYLKRCLGSQSTDVTVLIEAGYAPENEEAIDELVSQSLRSDVGAVGGKLLDGEGRIVLSGIVLGVGTAKAGSIGSAAFYLQPDSLPGQLGRAHLTQCFSALGMSCIAFRSSAYEQVDGFEFDELSIPLLTIDYCLKQWKVGNRVVWTPYSRFRRLKEVRVVDYGPDSIICDRKDKLSFFSRWSERIRQDPYYHKYLNKAVADFSLGKI